MCLGTLLLPGRQVSGTFSTLPLTPGTDLRYNKQAIVQKSRKRQGAPCENSFSEAKIPGCCAVGSAPGSRRSHVRVVSPGPKIAESRLFRRFSALEVFFLFPLHHISYTRSFKYGLSAFFMLLLYSLFIAAQVLQAKGFQYFLEQSNW